MAKSKTKLAEAKRRLVKKYENLAKVAGSRPKQKTYLYNAARYRRQAEQLEREGSAEK